MVDLKALIAKAQAEVEAATESSTIEVGGQLVDVSFRQVAGHVWADLVVAHPPRPGTDGNIGFNSDLMVRDYPAESITVDGQPVDGETWRELFAVVTSPNIKFMAAAIWALNQNNPTKRIVELGKARAGVSTKKRRSPASSASASADSQGGSPRK